MARHYTTVTTEIFEDPSFAALSAGAQRTYFLLITQREISPVGTLALTMRRWAKTCPEKDLEVWLAELSDHGFVLIDEDHEELLVRTFAKWDQGYKHALRAKAVIAAAGAIRSPLLKAAAATELAKLNISTGTPEPPDSHSEATGEDSESHRVVVTEVGYENNPQSATSNTNPRTPLPPASGGRDCHCGRHVKFRKDCANCQSVAAERRAVAEAESIAAKLCKRCEGTFKVLDPDTRKPTAEKCVNHLGLAVSA